jgi:predicted metal-dependent peptidase
MQVAPPQMTEQDLEEARKAAKRLIDKARAYIVLDHPFFASIMLKHPFTESLQTPTLCVTDGGQIYYNPAFIAQQSAEQVVWAVCHEVLHYASGHGIRVGHRDRRKWNWAGDAWINDTLKEAGIGSPIPGTVTVPGSSTRTVEDIYASIPDDQDGSGKVKGKGKGPSTGQQPPGPGQGNDPMEGDLQEGDATEGEKEELDAQRKVDIAEAAQVAKMKGKLPGVLAKFAAEAVESKVPWFDILERYMTERVKNDYSWARPNRRYMPDHYLPVMDGVGAMGEVVFQIDISGSVSKQEIQHYNGHGKRIVEQCRPAKVHVIYTDTKVQKHEVFDRPEDFNIQFYSGGGTDMRAGFDYIEKAGIEPEVVVTLTDGYTPWPSSTAYPAIWCISHESNKAPCGENIHFSLNDEK